MSNITQMRVKGVDYDLSNLVNSTKTNSLENLDCSKNLIQATVSKATNFSLNGEMQVGQKIKLFIISNGKFAQTISGDNIKTDFGTEIDINKGDIIQLEIECYDTNKYFISGKGAKKQPTYYITVYASPGNYGELYKYHDNTHTSYDTINLDELAGDNLSIKIDDLKYGFVFPRTQCNKIDLTGLNTNFITNMIGMFAGCELLTSLDVSNFDTSKVTDMGGMFDYCALLTSLDLSNFDTSKVTSMNSMFAICISLTSLDLSNFDTSKVTSMNSMFASCTSLNHIKCKQAFKDWCWANQDTIALPTAMRSGGGGTWEIVG